MILCVPRKIDNIASVSKYIAVSLFRVIIKGNERNHRGTENTEKTCVLKKNFGNELKEKSIQMNNIEFFIPVGLAAVFGLTSIFALARTNAFVKRHIQGIGYTFIGVWMIIAAVSTYLFEFIPKTHSGLFAALFGLNGLLVVLIGAVCFRKSLTSSDDVKDAESED